MIKNIIFDFGDVFINLNKNEPQRSLSNFGSINTNQRILLASERFEVGEIDTKTFAKEILKTCPKATLTQILIAWNAMLLDFPKYRLDFLQRLAVQNKYKLILLSNTNEEHIRHIREHVSFFKDFKKSFTSFYLSHEIGLRKPNANIFEYVLHKDNLVPSETLFIDDTITNTITADRLGIHTWNIIPGKEDIIDLLTVNSNLF